MYIHKRILTVLIFFALAAVVPLVSPAQGELPAMNKESDVEVIRNLAVLEMLELLEQEPRMLDEYEHFRDLDRGGIHNE